jgi:hypothetical protein
MPRAFARVCVARPSPNGPIVALGFSLIRSHVSSVRLVHRLQLAAPYGPDLHSV